mgnify:CR=1 FL=1
MNSRFRELMHKQANHNSLGDDDSVIEFFGGSSEFSNSEPNQKKKEPFHPEKILLAVKGEMIPKSFILVGVLLIMESIIMMVYMHFMGFLGAVLLSLFSFLLARKVRYKYTDETNFYFYNFTVTLKGVLEHYRTTSILMEVSEKLFLYSIFLMTIQHFLLSWFSLTSILYSVGYYGMLLGIILNLAKRETKLIANGLFFYSIMLALMTIQNALFSHYINYHTIISLFLFLYLTGFFHSLNIERVHIDNKEKTNSIKQ